jgi:hypothetical protein
LDRITNSEGKAWNQADMHREFIESAKKILYNYLSLSLTAEDLFPTSNLQVPSNRFQMVVSLDQDEMRIAYKLIQLFFWRMPSDVFLNILKASDNSKVVLDNMLKCLFKKYESLNILDPLVADILDLLQIIFEDPAFTDVVFSIGWAPL